MIKKVIAIGILCIFISSSLITTSTLGIKVNKSNDTLISENGDGKTEYWGLFIAPTDFKTGDDSFIFNVVILKQILLRNGWQENHINQHCDHLFLIQLYNKQASLVLAIHVP